jgi:hypothetical protein
MTSLERVEAIVKAVLYEGYMLYPYRPSSVKNHQRWTFGGVYPRDCAARDESLRATMQTECLVTGNLDAVVEIRVRFLHLLKREVGRFEEPLAELSTEREPLITLVPHLSVGDKRFHAWEEAVERTVKADSLTLNELIGARVLVPFRFAGQRELEPLRAADEIDETIPGVLIRSAVAVEGALTISAREVVPSVFKLTVSIENVTPVERPAELGPDGPQQRAFASTHTILRIEGGEFISLLDPPDALAEAARQCDNQGTWPVMAGEEGTRDIVLSSPIILYDYPQIAPESPGDLFDATEIDEILTLRILAMTDEEKRDMAAVDPRSRALLERTEALTAAAMARLHGTLRDPRLGTSRDSAGAADPWRAIDAKPQLAFLRVHGADLKIGDRVRLSPKAGADIMDIVLKDEVAVIEAIERDFEDKIHVAVVLENDPGREFGLDRMPGHRFFFSPDEIEAVSEEHRP